MRGALVLLVLWRSAALEEEEDEDVVRETTVLGQEGGRMGERDGEVFIGKEGSVVGVTEMWNQSPDVEMTFFLSCQDVCVCVSVCFLCVVCVCICVFCVRLRTVGRVDGVGFRVLRDLRRMLEVVRGG